jgi:MFS superfamily sulfate permease-like transporter/CRP-like cAMP-binding protein
MDGTNASARAGAAAAGAGGAGARGTPRPAWAVVAGEAKAAFGFGLVVVTQALVHGLVAFGALGPRAAAAGMAAALLASAAAGVVTGLSASTRPLVAGTSAITALVTASFLAAAEPASLAEAMALAMLLAAAAGLLLLLAAAAGLGRLAGLVPAPVTMGLVNAGVVLILLGQAPLALGLLPGQAIGTGTIHPASLVVAAVSAGAMWLKLPAIPSSVLALAGGTAAHLGLAAAAVPLGPTLGYAPGPELLVAVIGEAWREGPALAAREGIAAQLTPAALSLTVLVALEALVGITMMRTMTGRRADERRDLAAVGAGCLAAAVTGGFPGSVLGQGSLSFWQLGGRGRLGLALRAGVSLACLAVAGRVIAALPFAALAGTLVGLNLPLFRWRPMLPRSGPGFARRAADALMIAVIVIAGAVLGLAVSIFIGVLLSVIVFTGSMAQTVVRRSVRSPVGRSRVRRPAADVALLAGAGHRIELVEVEGALFFGTADRLLDHLARLRREGVEIIILDLERVTRIDATGGQRLAEACRAGGRVLVAPLHPASRAATELAAIGLGDAVPAASAWPTLADALEAAEDALLASLRGGAGAPERLAEEEVLAGLGLPQRTIAPILARMRPCRFRPGEAILRSGERSDAAYLLLSGQTLVSLPGRAGGPATRLAVLAPGTVFGELALLGAERRSADVTARGEVTCLRLGVAEAHALREENPDAAWHLLVAVARQTAVNLTAANAALDG